MPKDNFENVFSDRLVIDPEVCAMLGKTQEQIAKMDLREFAELIYNKGYEASCNAFETPKHREGRLTITVEDDAASCDAS